MRRGLGGRETLLVLVVHRVQHTGWFGGLGLEITLLCEILQFTGWDAGVWNIKFYFTSIP